LVGFASDSLRWANLNGNGGTLYLRRSEAHWSAILSRTDRPDRVYEMKRHGP
jgi:hypothetical protein